MGDKNRKNQKIKKSYPKENNKHKKKNKYKKRKWNENLVEENIHNDLINIKK